MDNSEPTRTLQQRIQDELDRLQAEINLWKQREDLQGQRAIDAEEQRNKFRLAFELLKEEMNLKNHFHNELLQKHKAIQEELTQQKQVNNELRDAIDLQQANSHFDKQEIAALKADIERLTDRLRLSDAIIFGLGKTIKTQLDRIESLEKGPITEAQVNSEGDNQS